MNWLSEALAKWRIRPSEALTKWRYYWEMTPTHLKLFLKIASQIWHFFIYYSSFEEDAIQQSWFKYEKIHFFIDSFGS